MAALAATSISIELYHPALADRLGDTKHAEVSFVLAVDRAQNTLFNHHLFDIVGTTQLRHAAIGLGGGLVGSGDYTIAIVGTCNGAIDDVEPLIVRAASNLINEAALLKAYRATATCAEKDNAAISR